MSRSAWMRTATDVARRLDARLQVRAQASRHPWACPSRSARRPRSRPAGWPPSARRARSGRRGRGTGGAVIFGTVTMKMMRRTIMMSAIGVTLMSDTTPRRPPRLHRHVHSTPRGRRRIRPARTPPSRARRAARSAASSSRAASSSEATASPRGRSCAGSCRSHSMREGETVASSRRCAAAWA